jgi:hypothetical protein
MMSNPDPHERTLQPAGWPGRDVPPVEKIPWNVIGILVLAVAVLAG